jgi:hypothetical protein
MPKLPFQKGIIVQVHEKGWFDDRITKDWLQRVWQRRPGAGLITWTCTIIPLGNGSFGIVFLLKTTYGGSFPPSAVQANITVKRFFDEECTETEMELVDPI